MSRKGSRALVVRGPAGPPVATTEATALRELEEQKQKLEERARSGNTKRSYDSDWKSWLAFCGTHGFSPLPADPAQVALYLAQLTSFGGSKGGKLRPLTAARHVAAIAAAHRAGELAFDSGEPSLRKTLTGIKRAFGAKQGGAPALRHDDILAVCKGIGRDLRGTRNRAIILLGFAGALRRSELVGLNVSDLEFGTDGLRVWLRRSKTDQDGKGRPVGIVPGEDPLTCPILALRGWLRAAEIEDDGENPVFRPVNRWGDVELNRLSDRSIDSIVKEACAQGRLEGRYSAHSLRVGHVTEALSRGGSRARVRDQTDHASDPMLDRYAREANLFVDSNSGKLGL
jgi:integrase